MTEKDFRFEALPENTFLHLPHYPRISCEACVFCDPSNESDGGTADKPESPPSLKPIVWISSSLGSLPSVEPGAQWCVCDSSPKLLHEDLLISSELANRPTAGKGTKTPKGPLRAWGASGPDYIYLRIRHENHNRLASMTLSLQYFRRSSKRL